jgi:hypothetical protein
MKSSSAMKNNVTVPGGVVADFRIIFRPFEKITPRSLAKRQMRWHSSVIEPNVTRVMITLHDSQENDDE